jgi:type I restriction enzyme S subunit
MSAVKEIKLPAGWEWCALEDVAEVRLGRQRSPKNHSGPNMVPYLRAANVTWSGLDLNDVKEMHFSEDEVETYRLEAGDLIVAEASGSASEVGKPAIWRGELAMACFQNTLLRVRSQAPLPEYLLLVLREAAVSGRFGRASLGVGINHLSRERLASWTIPLPPLSEQKRIVQRVDTLLGLIDLGVDSSDLAHHAIQPLRAAALAMAVTGRLVSTHDSDGDAGKQLARILERRRAEWEANQRAQMERAGRKPRDDRWKAKYKPPLQPAPPPGTSLPTEWVWATVDQLSNAVQYGTSAKTREERGTNGVPVLRMGNIIGGRIETTRLKYLPSDHSEFPELLLRDGDLLFNRTNSPELVGKSAVYRGEDGDQYSFASYLIRVRFVEGVIPEYVALYINSPFGRRWIASVVTQQVGQANVNGSKLRSLTLPFPALKTQARIVAAAQRHLRAAEQLAGALAEGRRFSDVLVRSVLAAGCAGELTARSPDDEPAAAMLARVARGREERDAKNAGRRKRRSKTAVS